MIIKCMMLSIFQIVLPSLGSYCLISTSSTQSAGNQPVRPLTLPSQNPPSPMDSTGGTNNKNMVNST